MHKDIWQAVLWGQQLKMPNQDFEYHREGAFTKIKKTSIFFIQWLPNY